MHKSETKARHGQMIIMTKSGVNVTTRKKLAVKMGSIKRNTLKADVGSLSKREAKKLDVRALETLSAHPNSPAVK